MNEPLSDPVAEAQRLLGLAAERDLPLRLLGGVAVRLRVPDLPPTLQRDYKDIDVMIGPGAGATAGDLLNGVGYEGDRQFNTQNGHRRMLFWDSVNGRQLDVFVGEFSMCHQIPIGERVARDPLTIPLAELLLTKLQIVELNPKDVMDAAAILSRFPLSEQDGDAINVRRIASLCAADWGLWRTTRMSVERLHERIPQLDFNAADSERSGAALHEIWDAIEHEPKSRRWKLRNRVGDRTRWYDEPDEPG